MGDRSFAYRDLVVKPEERDHLEDLGIDWKIILKWIFETWDKGDWTVSLWLICGKVGWIL
jgi:hypothetical protein